MTRLDVTGRPTSMRPAELRRLFRPARVAVVGASDTPGRPNTGIWKRLVSWSAEVGAEIIPVNPTKSTIDGRTCVPSLAEVDGDIDVAALLVSDVHAAVEEAIERKVAFAVAFASGFAETGADGREKQQALEELVAGSDLRLLGPNTNLNLFESFRQDLHGGKIALVSQSGHQGRPIFQGQDLGIGVSYWAPTGNEVDLEFADFVQWFANQPDTAAIAAYIEGFKDGRSLQLAADHAARSGVPIAMVKVGRTQAGAAMAGSHTGKLAGTDAVVSAALRQYGITRVDGLDELLDVSQMFARFPQGPANGAEGAVIYSISGGTGAHMADLCAARGIPLPTLSDDLQERLHQWIPPYLHVANPVDSGGHPLGDERGPKILQAILDDPAVGLLICPITGAFPPLSDRFAESLVAAAETTDKPICVIWGSPAGLEPAYRETLLGSERIAVFRTFGNCVTAIGAWLDWHRFRSQYRSALDKPVLRPSKAAAGAKEAITGRAGITEAQAKSILQEYGIPITREVVVTSAAEAARAAHAISEGSPVVLKVSGADLGHKSDVGGVRVGVAGTAGVKRAYAELAAISGGEVLVSELIDDGVAEMVVGVTRDPLFGPVVMLGMGGVFIEVLKDVTFRVPPFNRPDVVAMVEELSGKTMLRGARGRPLADERALVDVVMKVQRLAVDLHDVIAEVDINPLVLRARGQGAVALDALIVPG